MIRERPPEGALSLDAKSQIWLSDIQPVRHLQYVRTQSGLGKLAQELGQVFSEIIVAAPFDDFDYVNVPLPLNLGACPRILQLCGLGSNRVGT